MSELITKENTAIQKADPMEMIQSAVEKGMDVESLSRLMDLQERWEAGNAKKMFFQAFNSFQSTVPAIKKLTPGHNGNYAAIGDIAEQIRPYLKENDLSYRFEQDHQNGVTVTCIVSHVDGHSERTTMTAQPDMSGKKNPIQAIASTVTYLQRYTLIGALGITTADQDLDGRLAMAGGNFLGGEQLAELETMLTDTGTDRNKFLAYFKIQSLGDLPESQFAQAVAMLKRKGGK